MGRERKSILFVFFLTYPRIFAITFDETYYRAIGGRAGVVNAIIAAATAVTVVLGLKIMGAMLISSLIVFPSISAMQNIKSFRGVVIVSAILSLLGFMGGLLISCLWENMPIGATVVLMNLLIFFISLTISYLRRAYRACLVKKDGRGDCR